MLTKILGAAPQGSEWVKDLLERTLDREVTINQEELDATSAGGHVEAREAARDRLNDLAYWIPKVKGLV